MAKPTKRPRWADSGGSIVEPSEGKKDLGWAAGDRPPAQTFNWLLNLTWQWFEWLDGFFTSAGAFSTPANQDITAGAGGDVIVSAGGEFKHGEVTLVVSGAAAERYEGGAQQWVYNDSILGLAAFWGAPSGANADVVFPINLKIGDRIKQIKVWVQDDNTAGHTVAMYLHNSVAADMLAGGSQIGATQTSAHDGTVQALTLSGLTTTVAAGNAYEVVLRSGAAGTMKIMSLEVTYDRP